MNSSGRAQVADFGIARPLKHTFLTTKHVNAGTIAYMAPELFQATYVDQSKYALIIATRIFQPCSVGKRFRL